MLRDGFVLGWWNHALIGLVLIRMEYSLLAVIHRYIGPQTFGNVTAEITNMKCNNLARLVVHGDPDPLLMGLLLHRPPHLFRFGFQPSEYHLRWIYRRL